MLKRSLTPLVALALASVVSPSALAALHATESRYPTKPIRLIVPLTAGGPTDTLARMIAAPLGSALRQRIIVDNRPGAGGNIGATMAARAPADGYTLFMATSGPLSINQSLYRNLPYNPTRDFAPIMLVASAPFVVIVNPSVQATSVRSLIALARKKPNALDYGAVTGSASHLATELFKMMAGIKMLHVPYKGAAQATEDVIAGHIQVSFASTPGAIPVVQAGKVRALAVTSNRRIGKLPDVPTVAESGIPGYEASVWYGMVAPAHTPKSIVLRLNKDLVRVLDNSSEDKKMLATNYEPTTSTPAQFATFMRTEAAKWARVVKATGIHEGY